MMSIKKKLVHIYYFRYFHNKNIHIGKDFSCRKRLIRKSVDGGKIKIGNHCWFNNGCSVYSRREISFGDNVLIGENVHFYDHNHVFNLEGNLIGESGFQIQPIHIGNNVWIGTNCVILAGTTIGDGSVIGAGCVVSGNIPPHSVVKSTNQYIVENIHYKGKKE